MEPIPFTTTRPDLSQSTAAIEATVLGLDARFTVLTPRLIRMEHDPEQTRQCLARSKE